MCGILTCLSPSYCRFPRNGFVFFKQKTANDVRISYWSSDVCSSDLVVRAVPLAALLMSEDWQTTAVAVFITFGSAVTILAVIATSKIGRASCRERVGQYV